MSTPSNRLLKLCLVGATFAATMMLDVDTSGIHLQPRDAQAIIGRPFTPMSYAGVARRTTRRAVGRTAYVGAAYSGSYYGGGSYYGTPAATLPSNCVPVPPAHWRCGGVRYQAAYDGPNVVYAPY